MNPDQQLREALDSPHDLLAYLMAAVGRLLEPIPDEVLTGDALADFEADVLERYRAWLIGGDDA